MKKFFAILALTIASTLMVAPAQATPTRDIPSKACKYEDSTNCIWDAKHMGNGVGRSYFVTGPRSNPKVTYITHKRAHRLLTGWDYAL